MTDKSSSNGYLAGSNLEKILKGGNFARKIISQGIRSLLLSQT